MSYSEGPWVLEKEENTRFDHITGEKYIKRHQWINSKSGKILATIGISSEQTQETEANARLVVCAPEMFELLEDLNEILPTALHNGHHDLIARVKELIKKARGS